VSDHHDTRELETRAGVFSGVAAGILIIALTAMGLIAFQPSPTAPMHASSISAASAGAGAR